MVRYEELVEAFQQRLPVDRQQAETALAATMQALNETAHEAMQNLQAQLPDELKQVTPAGTNAERSLDEFVVRVGDLTGLSDATQARERTQAAFSTLAEAVSTGQLRELMESLQPEFRDLAPGSVGLSGSDETFLGEVRQQANLDSVEAARELSEAVLRVLAAHSSAGQARDLAAYLPDQVSTALRTTRSAPGTEADEFFAQVDSHATVTDSDHVREHTIAVFDVLRRWAPKEMESTLDQLPKTITKPAKQ